MTLRHSSSVYRPRFLLRKNVILLIAAILQPTACAVRDNTNAESFMSPYVIVRLQRQLIPVELVGRRP